MSHESGVAFLGSGQKRKEEKRELGSRHSPSEEGAEPVLVKEPRLRRRWEDGLGCGQASRRRRPRRVSGFVMALSSPPGDRELRPPG